LVMDCDEEERCRECLEEHGVFEGPQSKRRKKKTLGRAQNGLISTVNERAISLAYISGECR